jgi:putative transposase
MSAPHQVWTADFTGHCNTGDGLSCAPLPVAAGYRRFLRARRALHATAVPEATPVFTRLGQEFGLPLRIRTENGVPWATQTLARLSPRSAEWGRLGSLPACIPPGTPQQTGRHARLPRPLNADTTRPPTANRRAHQRRCNRVREECNHQRPHEALDRQPPAALYGPSPRPMPSKRPPLEYPDRVEVRSVGANGGLRWNRRWVNVSITGAGEYGGREAIDDGSWHVCCGPRTRARLHARQRRSEDASGRRTRPR